MAIVNTAGTIFVDVEGIASSSRTKVTYLIFSTANATATLVLRDGVTDSAPIKMSLKLGGANSTLPLDFSRLPIIFQNGIYCDNIASGDTVSIVTTSIGSNA